MTGNQRAAQRFGREMSRLRRRADITQERLARELGVSGSHISNLETGKRSPTLSAVPLIDEAVGANGQLVHLWDDLTGNGHQAWIVEIFSLIRESAAVYDYQNMVIPGFLQTEDYARSLIRYGAPFLTPDEVDERVRDRMSVARELAEAASPIVWCVIDETVLWRRFGSPAITRGQFAYVLDLAERGRVTLQIVPATAPRHPGNSGSFLILAGQAPDVAYAESVHEGQTITAPADIARYRMLFGALQAEATDPGTAIEMLRNEMRKLDHEQHE